METKTLTEAGEFLYNNLRLRTLPIGVKFLEQPDFPAKTVRPSESLSKKITICQGVTMARLYGWSVGLAKKDVICVPAAVAFGLAGVSDQAGLIGTIFCNVTFAKTEQSGRKESDSMSLLDKKKYQAILLSPLARIPLEPDIVAVYGNPAQIMRMTQAWVYADGERVAGNFGGKVECSEYLIAPFLSGNARISIPGGGDRIFSMTQDDEMVFSFPANQVERLIQGLKEAGRKIGAKYPVTFYQNFQPEFPKYYKTLGKEIGIED
jgi:uncharacterized protein (DUF169 family)